MRQQTNTRLSDQFTPPQHEWWKLLFAVGATVSIVYFGHMRPADRNLLMLQRQCHELKVAVNELTRESSGADHTLGVIESLSAHNRRLIDAERELAAIAQRWQQVSERAEAIAARTAPLGELNRVESSLATHGQALDAVLDAVDDLEIVQRDVTDSPEKLARANASIGCLYRLQSRLTSGLDRVNQAAPALDQMDRLCDNLVESQQSLAAAQQHLAEGSKQNLGQIAAISKQIDVASADAAQSQREQLAQLNSFKQQVIASGADLPEAEATLARLNDMQAAVRMADGTLNDIQHMVVDVMLIEPAAQRAVTALKPVVEFTRLSRRLENQPQAAAQPLPTTESKQVADDAQEADDQLDIANTILNWF